MKDVAIKIENLSKYYRLGQINNGTLYKDIQSWIALKCGKDDPNSKLFDSHDGSKDGFWALKDLSFEIKKGDRVGIIGRNGAGKSTLLKIISEITTPTTGDIYIKGKIASLLEVGTGFNPEMTGRENIYLNGAILGMTKKEIASKIDKIIEFSEIEKYIDTPVKRYSSGMYVRLAFAVAAYLDSDILIADEVLAVGDASFQKKALGKMNELSSGAGRTVLFVSHNLSAVRQLCNKGIVLDKGEVLFNGDIEDAITTYGISGKNYLEVKYCFENFKRIEGSGFILGKICKIISIDIINKTSPQYTNNEKIVFNISLHVFNNIDNVEFAAVLQNSSDIPIGFIQEKNRFNTYKKGAYEKKLSFDISNLCSGIYQIYFQVYQIQENGFYQLMDQVDKIYFEIVKDPKVEWMSRYWGNVKLNDFE